MTRTNQAGQAIWELLLAFSVISILVGSVLFAGYFLFARAWVTYQTEQALYCVSERQPVSLCRQNFAKRVARFLPWGDLQIQTLNAKDSGAEVQATWRIREFSIPLRRNLDLSWSKRSRSSRF